MKSIKILPLLAAIANFQINSSVVSAFLPPSTISAAPSRSIPSAFVTSPIISPCSRPHPLSHTSSSPPRHDATRRSTHLQGVFGLGPAELVIIAIAGIIFIGPSKLLEFSKEAGSVAGQTSSGMGDEWNELKAIPEEFQKGVEEGEIDARSRKAKDMDEVGEETQVM
eukprot:CAMPEP_0172297838 /NCGR_PEP_ID=MMETSP1058-20130122/721_1 /TAXON_ID=83371 /ORGANISM="Detonula confervacea, Strain CCMP 353" /LENGTH=166 /DNA_ID=CAMNT_0013007039 /DNA_START=21 /DNA_END=521 /DNA_ORIENTATION=+